MDDRHGLDPLVARACMRYDRGGGLPRVHDALVCSNALRGPQATGTPQDNYTSTRWGLLDKIPGMVSLLRVGECTRHSPKKVGVPGRGRLRAL